MKALQGAGLLLPLKPESFDGEDLVRPFLKAPSGTGFTPAEASFYSRLAREMVDFEMAIRNRLVKGLSLEDNATLTLELTRGARALGPNIIDRIFQHRVISRKSFDGEEEE